MEGPTPVSALIHAATMVAAGVFLVARVYPLMEAQPPVAAASVRAAETLSPALSLSEREREKTILAAGHQEVAAKPMPHAATEIKGAGSGKEAHGDQTSATSISTALKVVTWIGTITAVFAACIAVAQTDIKRILAYSTVSQLGFMMMGLGAGGVAVGMFHLITHAFFKALLFLGAGSVIHGCGGEQDIRRMGGLKQFMPVTFATYAIGMMALAGVPLFFSGFWSKDEILHAASAWPASRWPFYLGLFGALLTAFYMTRQMCYVFGGGYRGQQNADAHTTAHSHTNKVSHSHHAAHAGSHEPHESPRVMTVPLRVLAAFAILLGFFGTPAWPWFHDYLTGHHSGFSVGRLFEGHTLLTMLISSVIVFFGIAVALLFYAPEPVRSPDESDPVESLRPGLYAVLRDKFYIDELYQISVIRLNAWFAWLCNWFDRRLWEGVVQAASHLVIGFAWLSRLFDELVINLGFDQGCRRIRKGGQTMAGLQKGQVQQYLSVIGIALTVLLLLLTWGFGR
ncbi:MAG: hypothetical protein FJ403_13390 [Verrucomicrobia bacterium]|nr:hypothetical protein [Verrucomicrobiota bacterium]